jgi:hypothetical protein
MRHSWKVAIALLVAALNIQAAEIPVKSRLMSLELFKNGLTVVKKAVSVSGPGAYRIDDVPEPVHGTFWIESGAGVEARVTSQTIEVPINRKVGTDFQEELVGCEVTIHFREGAIPPATGTIIAIERAKGEDAWGRTRQPMYGNASQQSIPGRFLVLNGPEGRTYVDSSMVAYLHTKGGDGTIKQRKPVLLLTVPKTDGKPTEIFISYLTQGVSWAPSYRVDLSNPDTLSIEQNAVVKNELGDIENAEISLISGFPSVQFAHVTSPLSLRTTWAQFFQQLNQRVAPNNPIGSNIVSQQAVMSNYAVAFNNAPEGGVDLSAMPSGEGVDLHYQSIGKRTLIEGDSLAVSTASGKAPYKRIIEWIVPDTRTANGRYIDEYQRRQDPDKYEDAAWDAVRFKNPLPFPMTTAPAMIVSKGQFNGQRMTFWVNKGEETTLHITKALSIRTHHAENEESGNRDIVYIGGTPYRKVAVKGGLVVNNHRNEPVSMVIRRQFSGDLLSADGSPKSVLREEGVYSVNKRNELLWTFDLKPGEEKTLAYRYSVLVVN